MRFTKYTHACARIEAGGVTVVIDPGGFSEPESLHGAQAVLITHEHFDHLDADKLRSAAAERDLLVWTNAAVAGQLADVAELAGRVRTVGHGDTFTVGPSAGGLDVHVYGEKHAKLHPDLDPPANIGFHLGGLAFYPGDALTVPEEPTPTLLTPTDAPWLRQTDLLAYVREVRPKQAFSMHDGLLNERGLAVLDALKDRLPAISGSAYRRLRPGEAVDLD